MLEDKNYELWHGDCLELMKNIPDKSIDCIICDLPYGTTSCSWDIVIPFDKLWEQYNRILKKRRYSNFIRKSTIYNMYYCFKHSKF